MLRQDIQDDNASKDKTFKPLWLTITKFTLKTSRGMQFYDVQTDEPNQFGIGDGTNPIPLQHSVMIKDCSSYISNKLGSLIASPFLFHSYTYNHIAYNKRL